MKYFENYKFILAGAIASAMIAALLTGCSGTGANNSGITGAANQQGNTTVAGQTGSTTAATQAQNSSGTKTGGSAATLQVTDKDKDGDGIPDTVEKTYGTNPLSADTDGDGVPDKTDKDPCFTPNLIKETGTTPLDVKVKDARVEDNVNASDHLEITLTNTGNAALKDFDIYYTVTDAVTKKVEGYYAKLTGLTLEAGATKTLHFDNKQADLHYNGNFNGIYGISKNEVLFQGQIHSAGYASLSFSTKKAKGTAEVAD